MDSSQYRFPWMSDEVSLEEMSAKVHGSLAAFGWRRLLSSLEAWIDEADSTPPNTPRAQKIARCMSLLSSIFLKQGENTTPEDVFNALLRRSRWSSVTQVKAAASECLELLASHGVEWAKLAGSEEASYRQLAGRCARPLEEYEVGSLVITTRDAGSIDWVDHARANCRWGVKGRVVDTSNGHGQIYRVEHDGVSAWYEPRELRTSEMAIRTVTSDGTRVIAKHGTPHANVSVMPEDNQAWLVLQKADKKLHVLLTPEQTKEFAADLLRSVGEDPEHALRELRRQGEDLEATLSEIAFFSKALGNGSLTEVALAWEGLSSHERREAILKRIEYLAELADATRRMRGGPTTNRGWVSFPRQINVAEVPTEDLPRMLNLLCGINERDALAFVESLRVGHSCLATSSPIVVVQMKRNDLFAVLQDKWGLWLRAAKDHVRWDISVRI